MNRLLSINPACFNDAVSIQKRVYAAALLDQGSLRTALNYLYMDDGCTNLPRDRLLRAKPYLDEAERVLVQWLYTRTNGSERKNYGKDALLAARRSRYRCEHCDFADVRTLNLDHVEGRVTGASFACLCANCHAIKSREKDWTGVKQTADSSRLEHGGNTGTVAMIPAPISSGS